jgi:CysZ protein
MKSIQHHLYGIKATFEALSKGKFLLFFVPTVVAALLYYMVFYSVDDYRSDGGFFGTIWNWIIDFAEWIMLVIFQFVVLTLLSPFNAALSEKFDEELTGKKFDSGIIKFLNDFLRMILVVVIALTLELFFSAILWVIGIFLPESIEIVLSFILTSFFFGFAFFDFSLERHGVSTIASLGFAFSRFSYMVFTGAIFSLLFMIPIAGIILAPILATMISTAVYTKMHEQPATPPETKIN